MIYTQYLCNLTAYFDEIMNKMMDHPLVNQKYILQKFPGKGGWTYAAIPEVLQSKETPFGWVKVKGSIDGFDFEEYNLSPMGNGQLFLPVRKEIRKKIKKEAGDWVHIILYEDNLPLEIPEEFILCLSDEPESLRFFNGLSEVEKNRYVQWIYSAKTDEIKVQRIVHSIHRLSSGMLFSFRK